MGKRTADSTFDEIYDATDPPADCGLCIFIASVAALLWTLVKL